MTDRRFHVEFKDGDSGESLGLILTETPQIGLQRRLINPYAAKTGQGNTQYSDLTEWTVVAQDNWTGGRAQDSFEHDNRYYDARGLETRIQDQFTLGPYPHPPDDSKPSNITAPDEQQFFGWSGEEQQAHTGSESGGWDLLQSDHYIGQQVNEQWHEIPASQDVALLKSVEVYIKKISGFPDGGVITLSVYSHDSTNEVPDASLGSKTMTGADLTTDYAWKTFTFDSPIDLSDHEDWWIVLSHNTDNETIRWLHAGSEDFYKRGAPAMKNSMTGGSWWRYPFDGDMTFKAHWCNIKMAQSFTTATGLDLESVSVYGSLWFKPIKVSLYSDSGDEPDTLLRSCVIGSIGGLVIGADSTTTVIKLGADSTTTRLSAYMWVEINDETRMIDSVDSSTQFTLKSALTSAPAEGDRVYAGYYQAGHHRGWKKARFNTVLGLNATTKYWIVVEQFAEGTTLYNGWSAVEYGGSYADGSLKHHVEGVGWSAVASRDLLFSLNDIAVLDGTVVAFARYDGGWYCGAGDTVYKWNEGTLAWDTSDEQAGKDVTGLAVWGGYLWAARGSDHVLRRYGGSTWADITGHNATLLKAGGGYLHYSGAGLFDHVVYYTSDGSTWSSLGECGGGDYPVRGLAWYRDTLLAATDVALWNLSVEDWAYPVLDWSHQESEHNGVGMAAWNKDNCLYIPLRYGLYRWNGDSMVAAGPEKGTGLPEERAGNIVALAPTNNWLYAAVDAGADRVSSILCYNGMGGWHEIARHPDLRKRVKAVALSTINDPSRLWYGLGDETRYCELPDRGDNPYQWKGYAFQPTGELITSWFGSDLIEVVKDIQEIVVRGVDISEDQYIDLYIGIDRNRDENDDPLWYYWGRADSSPREAVTWDSTAATWGYKVVGSGSTVNNIVLDSDYEGNDVDAGQFVRVNGEIVQVQYGDDSNIVLASALSEAPESGDYVYSSRPAGREFRVMAQIVSEQVGSYVRTTPKVDAILVRYQNNVLDRFLWTLSVNCGGRLKQLNGSEYPLTAAELRIALDSWAKRETAFTLVDPDGRERTVKVTSAGEGGFSREEKAGGSKHYDSTYNFNLVEVE